MAAVYPAGPLPTMTTWCFSNWTISLGNRSMPQSRAGCQPGGADRKRRVGRPFGTLQPCGGERIDLDPAQLKQVPLFSNLTPEHLQKVAAIATAKMLKMNEHIFREGEIGTEMYI